MDIDTDNSLKSLSNNNVRLTKSTATTESPIKKTVKYSFC